MANQTVQGPRRPKRRTLPMFGGERPPMGVASPTQTAAAPGVQPIAAPGVRPKISSLLSALRPGIPGGVRPQPGVSYPMTGGQRAPTGVATPTGISIPTLGKEGMPTFPIGEELEGFESLTPSQQGVSEAFITALEAALAGGPGFDPSMAGAFSPYGGEVGGALESALLTALSGEFPEEMFQTSIADPTRRAFTEETAPAIREEFAGPGTFWGTARAGKVTGQRERMETGLVEKRAGLAEGALERALQATGPALTAQQGAISLAFEDYVNQHPGASQALAAALDYLGIPMLATYQPTDEKKPSTFGPGYPGPAIPGGPTYQAGKGR